MFACCVTRLNGRVWVSLLEGNSLLFLNDIVVFDELGA